MKTYIKINKIINYTKRVFFSIEIEHKFIYLSQKTINGKIELTQIIF